MCALRSVEKRVGWGADLISIKRTLCPRPCWEGRGGEGDRAIVLWRRRKRRRRDRNERGGGGGRPLLLLLRDRRADYCHSAEIWGGGGLGTCSRTSEEEEEGEETPFRTDKRSIRPTAPHHAAFLSSSRLWTSPRFIVDISPSLHFLDPRTYVGGGGLLVDLGTLSPPARLRAQPRFPERRREKAFISLIPTTTTTQIPSL